ncbi:MAG TPA: HRDC domain-containing protein, partial [Acidimicrobiales bacterium]|nr:HRDC domain-containing protein [Acidimicrobiales bacterium]
QLAWPGGVALVDALALDLGPLAKVLAGPGLAVAHAAEQDLEVLGLACGTVPARLFDTQLAARFIGMSGPSLPDLVDAVLGRPLAKGDRLTDWTRRPLTAAQRNYAAADVSHLLDLHRALVEELQALGRMAWAEGECELLRRRTHVHEPEQAWWRLREARSLRGRSRGVAQQVAAWRERRAAALDKPARHVLPDLAVASVAHHPPRSRQELERTRGLESRSLKASTAAELLAAVEAGLTLEESELRLPAVDEVDRRLRPAVALASAWIAQRAAELRLDPALLATKADLHALFRGDPVCRLLEGWRASVLGTSLRQLVTGKAAVALHNGALVLEERPGPFPVEATEGPAVGSGGVRPRRGRGRDADPPGG